MHMQLSPQILPILHLGDGNEVTEMIGTKFFKPLTEEADAAYTEAANWCNETKKATIEDMGDWYEVVAIPEPTPEEQAEKALAQAKAERADAVSRITVTVDGLVFDGDETAQDRMARAITMFNANNLPADTVTPWVLADNTVAEVTVSQLSQALLLAGQAQTALWTIPYEG